MAIRTRQFVNLERTAAGAAGLYTVGAGQRALIKYASIVSFATTPGLLTLYIYSGGSNAAPFLRQPAGATGVLYAANELYAVAEAGDIIAVNVGSVTGGNAYIHVGGVLFEL